MESSSSNDLEEAFDGAAKFIRSKADTLSSDKLLELYGLYKQATEGRNKTSKPNFWNVTAKQKWDAWTKHGGKPEEVAMEEYVSIVTEIDPTWQQKESSAGSWVHHSVLSNADKPLKESEKDIFHWVKENDVEAVKKAVGNGCNVNIIDDQAMGVLHWAADRGYLNIIDVLINAGVDLDLQDADGQTALHYASSCGHAKVVEVLLAAGAKKNITDSDGCMACDVAASEEVGRIFDR